jgi:hypothetical protein
VSSPQSSTGRGETLQDEIERELDEARREDNEAQRKHEETVAGAKHSERELRSRLEAEKASIGRYRQEIERQENERRKEMGRQEMQAAAVEK